MTAVVHLHPVVTNELMLKLGYQVIDYSFEYDLDARVVPLKAEALAGQEHIQSQLFLRDKLETWNNSTHNLRFRREIVLQNPLSLFGVSGVAGQNAEIGTAVMWASKQSSQRGIFIGESFNISTTKKKFEVTGEFSKGLLRERFQLTTILYLKNTGELIEKERHLAQKPGIVLGEFENTIFHLSGNGSIFPIFSLKEDGPLWRVECSWGEARSDSFDDDNVRIILNERHRDYKLTESMDQKQLSPLMKEIIASAIQIIIEKVKNEVPLQEILEGKDIERGSICMAVQYFISAFGLDISSPEKLAVSLRKHLDRRLGGKI